MPGLLALHDKHNINDERAIQIGKMKTKRKKANKPSPQLEP